MKRLVLILYLALLSLTAETIILQSTISTPIVNPAGLTAVPSAYYNTIKPGIAGNGVSWISSPKYAYSIAFESLFYVNCNGYSYLAVTAAESFNAYLDGIFIGSGYDFATIYTLPLTLACGNHNLTIIMYSGNPAAQALTFAIYQDQSNCFNCNQTGFWNQTSCSCSCINTQANSGCLCTSPKVWRDYPICGCGCPPSISRPINNAGIISAVSQATVVNTNAATPNTASSSAIVNSALLNTLTKIPSRNCPASRFFSENRCACVCHNQYCPIYKHFDEVLCACVDDPPR